MIRAGDLDRRIRILRFSATEDRLGAKAEGWTPAEWIWAGRKDVSDGERVRAEAQGITLNVRFTVRWSSLTASIKGRDRIEHDGVTFAIVGIKPVGRKEGFEISGATVQEDEA